MSKDTSMPGSNGSPRILVLNLCHIGDVVMGTAALRLLRKLCPNAHITLKVPAMSAGLMRLPELADEVIEEKEYKGKLLRSFDRTCSALMYRFARYDICFMFSCSRSDARRIKYLSNIPARVCASQGLGGQPCSSAVYATHVIPAGSVWSTHVADYFQDIIQGFFLHPQEKHAAFSREMTQIAEPDHRVNLPAAPGQKRVAFCFEGSPTNLSCWPEAYFADLLGKVEERGWYSYAAVPKDGTRYPKILAAQGAKVNLFECADIIDCCAWLREADLLISVDTAQVHLAAAMGIPLISIGGPTSCGTWPYSASGVMLASSSGCFSCPFTDDCPTNHANGRRKKPGFIPPCMRAITPAMVFERACEMLKD